MPKTNAERQAAYRKRKGVPNRADYEAQAKIDGKAVRDENKREHWRNRTFVAIDGEGEDDASHAHHYTMLTASNGSSSDTIQSNSLSTDECFTFLLSLKKKHGNAVFVAFSFDYDINMMLRDVDHMFLMKLWKDGICYWKGYTIQWIPSKIFTLSKGKKNAIRIFDTFGFFQKSFVSALVDWNVGTELQVSTILSMKKKRGLFSQVDNAQINEYNTLECVLLVEMMQKLRNALDTTGLYLTSWHGAGAIGGELLKLHKIHEHIETPPDNVQAAIMCAYYGGRFQTIMLGEHASAHSHDIRSAYPAAFIDLPSMKGTEWKEVTEWEETPYSLWHVRWQLPRNADTITPFPHRFKRRISYPTSGSGWYYYPEVKAAIAAYGDCITIERGFVPTFSTGEKPFSFLSGIYAQRTKFKKEGNDAQLVLKLGINSVYGKSAQGTVRRGKSNNGTPKFQSYYYAGYCTSLCRASVFRLSLRNPRSIIAFATDGVFATERLTTDEEEVNQLGAWEHGDNFYQFWVQSGVYLNVDKSRASSAHEKVHRKTRGLGKNEVSFAKLRKKWRNKKTRYAAKDTLQIRRFLGLQYCLHTNRMDLWRKWVEVTKTLTIWPNIAHYKAIEETDTYVRFAQLDHFNEESEPYIGKGSNIGLDEGEEADYLLDAAQPLWEG